MCTSKCSGICTEMVNKQETDVKESLDQINMVLNKIIDCNTSSHLAGKELNDQNMKNVIELRQEAKQLLDEVNKATLNSGTSTSLVDGCYNSKNLFIPLSVKERVFQLRKKFEAFQKNVFDKSLTQLSGNTF